MDSDLAAVNGLRNEVIHHIQKYLAPEEKIERIKIADVLNQSQAMASIDDVDKYIEQLREYLIKYIEAGTKVILE